jgi:hypothetical protein
MCRFGKLVALILYTFFFSILNTMGAIIKRGEGEYAAARAILLLPVPQSVKPTNTL